MRTQCRTRLNSLTSLSSQISARAVTSSPGVILSVQRGHFAAIACACRVSTVAGTFSPHPSVCSGMLTWQSNGHLQTIEMNAAGWMTAS